MTLSLFGVFSVYVQVPIPNRELTLELFVFSVLYWYVYFLDLIFCVWQADPYYEDLVEGLSPDPDLHNTYLRIEPLSGVPVEVVARFQLNVFLSKVSRTM